MFNSTAQISYKKLSPNAKCTRCKEKAEIHLPSHHANFCQNCFINYFNSSVIKVLNKAKINYSETILVAISGGKDSLAAWNALLELGYKTEGIHLDLGIPNFSEKSLASSIQFANTRKLKLNVYKLKDIFDYTILDIRKLSHRTICSVCGILKRSFLNRLAILLGYKYIATGHNLDDESSRLLGNILRNNEKHLLKSYPYLPFTEGLAGRIKPLFRLEGEEIKIYCQIKNIDFYAEKCPYSKGATSHIYKEALQFLELKMPGTKRYFLYTYIEKLNKQSYQYKPTCSTTKCKICNNLSLSEICYICKIKQEINNAITQKINNQTKQFLNSHINTNINTTPNTNNTLTSINSTRNNS